MLVCKYVVICFYQAQGPGQVGEGHSGKNHLVERTYLKGEILQISDFHELCQGYTIL